MSATLEELSRYDGFHPRRGSVQLNEKMNQKFFEYDVVRSIRSFAGVPLGTSGAVLMVFASDLPHYEAEFVDSTGESLAVLTVKEDDLERVQRAD
ncbi:DUF4926 domain-containing protein [Andreprevotia sp. IGB-42]|uniref:DUF4926 domain-containing protein n=1 Tax=Andreprevotia sp. IGB-42 TaxID=2497473 RepID=UPI00135A6F33|nr:DUF4926 domain-containing protein [Andreprevotia sp. IGB-42]